MVSVILHNAVDAQVRHGPQSHRGSCSGSAVQDAPGILTVNKNHDKDVVVVGTQSAVTVENCTIKTTLEIYVVE